MRVAEVFADTIVVAGACVVVSEVAVDSDDEDADVDAVPLASSRQNIPAHPHCNPASAGQVVPAGQ